MNSSFKSVQNSSNTNFNSIYSYILNTMFTVGDYKYSASNTDFNDWLLCDGRSLSINDYPDLFNVLGTGFGGLGGNFNLPNFAGRVLGVIGTATTPNSTGTLHTLGNNPGEETITLSTLQLPAHNHTGTTDSSGQHTHAITDPGHTHAYFNQPNTINPATSLTTTDVADNVNVNQTTSSSTTGITVNSNGAHTHTFTSNNTGGAMCYDVK